MSARPGGVFHPKVVLALCVQDGVESLVVAVSSANLTRGGWWTNLESADVVRLEDGERHGYLAGLQELVSQLDRSAPKLADQRATKQVRRFLQRQHAYTNATYDGVVRPTCCPAGAICPPSCAGSSATASMSCTWK